MLPIFFLSWLCDRVTLRQIQTPLFITMQSIVLAYTISIKYDLLWKICFNILDCFFISHVAFPPSLSARLELWPWRRKKCLFKPLLNNNMLTTRLSQELLSVKHCLILQSLCTWADNRESIRHAVHQHGCLWFPSRSACKGDNANTTLGVATLSQQAQWRQKKLAGSIGNYYSFLTG